MSKVPIAEPRAGCQPLGWWAGSPSGEHSWARTRSPDALLLRGTAAVDTTSLIKNIRKQQ